jgi:hypothetical protein
LQAVLNRCLPKARPGSIEKPERQVSTFVAIERGVVTSSYACAAGQASHNICSHPRPKKFASRVTEAESEQT